MPREGLGFPVSYPTSCSPQAWAAASPLLFLRTMLRFEPDIRRSLLHLAPAVPDWIGTLRLERIPIMGGHLGVEVSGDAVRVLEIPDGLEIVSDPAGPDPELSVHAHRGARSPGAAQPARAGKAIVTPVRMRKNSMSLSGMRSHDGRGRSCPPPASARRHPATNDSSLAHRSAS